MINNDKANTGISQLNALQETSFFNKARASTLAILPLCIAVIPWGVLCGTLSIEAGLSGFQAQFMSLIVFAGAAQLAGIAVFGAAGSWLSLLNSTSMIGVRHVLYSASYQAQVRRLPLIKRLLFAFLLTDEMFAVAQAEQLKTGRFDYWYAIVAGFCFYAIWNISTFIGIYTAHLLGDIEQMGFDFAIAAIFIAMVVPILLSNKASVSKETSPNDKALSKKTNTTSLYSPMLAAVSVSALGALICAYFEVNQGLIVSTLAGMATGALLVGRNNKDENSRPDNSHSIEE